LADGHDCRERQRLARDRHPAICLEICKRRIAGGQWSFDIGRRRQQRAFDLPRGRERPVGNHQRPCAVRGNHHFTLDPGQRFIERLDAGRTAQPVFGERLNGNGARQLRCQQRLPMFGNMIAQSRDKQDGNAV